MKFSAAAQTKFCDSLAELCNIGKACAAAGISRQTAYRWRAERSGFSQAWDAALQVGISALEDEAHRRAFEGIDKPIVFRGAITATAKEYSDALAMFLLKAHRPEKYRERAAVDLTNSDRSMEMSATDRMARIAQIMAEARRRRDGAD